MKKREHITPPLGNFFVSFHFALNVAGDWRPVAFYFFHSFTSILIYFRGYALDLNAD